MDHAQTPAPVEPNGIVPTQTIVNPPVSVEPQATNPAAIPLKKSSHKPSVTGIVLAVASLLLSAFGNLLVHAHAPHRETPTLDQKVGQAVDNGVMHVLGAIFGVPFLVGGIALALVSALFLALRLRKVRAAGIILTILAVLVIIWSFSIALGGFDYIRAKPAQ